MTDLADKQKTEYFRRSYTAVDGLWFMKLEEKHGLEEALQLDEAVWKVCRRFRGFKERCHRRIQILMPTSSREHRPLL